MLIEFTVGNFRSFHKKCTLSLEAQGINEEPKSNVVKIGNYKIVKTAAIYGANSSGKSNLIKAMGAMSSCVLYSVKLNDKDTIKQYEPFLLSTKNENNPTYFEVVFLLDGSRIRYGFEYDSFAIRKEWLFKKDGKTNEKALFLRNKEGIGISIVDFIEGRGYEEKTNDNRLFLSLCAQLGGFTSKKIIEWFQTGFNVISGIDNMIYKTFSCNMIHGNENCRIEAINLFKNLKLGFDSILSSEEERNIPSIMPKELKDILQKQNSGKKEIVIHTIHNRYNNKGERSGIQAFDVNLQESEGTKKLMDLAGPILDTLQRGLILIIDELDAKMHPLISEELIKLFNSTVSNPKNAQLIFSTHDTHLLASRLLRRDQIWFTEKDYVEQTDLYSMMDIVFPDGTKPRKDSNYEKNYINGRYGAIPFVFND